MVLVQVVLLWQSIHVGCFWWWALLLEPFGRRARVSGWRGPWWWCPSGYLCQVFCEMNVWSGHWEMLNLVWMLQGLYMCVVLGPVGTRRFCGLVCTWGVNPRSKLWTSRDPLISWLPDGTRRIHLKVLVWTQGVPQNTILWWYQWPLKVMGIWWHVSHSLGIAVNPSEKYGLREGKYVDVIIAWKFQMAFSSVLHWLVYNLSATSSILW